MAVFDGVRCNNVHDAFIFRPFFVFFKKFATWQNVMPYLILNLIVKFDHTVDQIK